MTDNPGMHILGIILARAGSKGLPHKCAAPLLGRPLIDYTFDHAAGSERLADIVLSTDSDKARTCAARRGIRIIDRPASLATDGALIDAAVRHAVEEVEAHQGTRCDAVVILYANIPVRKAGAIDRAIEHLLNSGADSVRTVAPVGKHHPDWLHRLDGDRMTQYRPNRISRRQDLEPLYYHDGAVIAVTRDSLFAAAQTPDDGQAFLGTDRRAIIQGPDDAVDVDDASDLLRAEAILRAQRTGSDAATTGPHEDTVSAIALAPDEPSHNSSIPIHPAPVFINGRPIGAKAPPYVIAEIGVNHNGQVERAEALIDAAANAGAAAAKFQIFDVDELVTRDAASADYQRSSCGESSQFRLLSSLALPDGAWERLADRCARRGLDFIATPFGPRALKRLLELSPVAVKLGSGDLTNRPLIADAAGAGLPLIISTGASHVEEIDGAIALARAAATGGVVVLHCVSCYPAPLATLNLATIRTLETRLHVPVGFSDHSLSTTAGGLAVMAGAVLIEKHLTFDPEASGPDHAASLGPADFRAYVRGIREAFDARGDGVIRMAPEEHDVRSAARRSIVAKVDIPQGTRLTGDMLICKRPGEGIPAVDLEKILDRETRVDIPRDTLLAWDQVE